MVNVTFSADTTYFLCLYLFSISEAGKRAEYLTKFRVVCAINNFPFSDLTHSLPKVNNVLKVANFQNIVIYQT